MIHRINTLVLTLAMMMCPALYAPKIPSINLSSILNPFSAPTANTTYKGVFLSIVVMGILCENADYIFKMRQAPMNPFTRALRRGTLKTGSALTTAYTITFYGLATGLAAGFFIEVLGKTYNFAFKK